MTSQKKSKLDLKKILLELKWKEATIVGMHGAAIKQRVVVIATNVSTPEKQIEMLGQTTEVLIWSWGQEKYDAKITELMDKMLDDRKMSGEELIREINDGNGDGNDDNDDE